MTKYRQHISLVRSLCEGTEAFGQAFQQAQDLDIPAFHKFLGAERLRPWLNPLLDDPVARQALPAEFLDPLRPPRKRNDACVARVISQGKAVLGVLSGAQIEALFFKGILSGADLYGDPYRRHQTDIDMMVERSNLRTVVDLLGTIGYDTSVDGSTGQPLEVRIARMLEKPFAAKAYTACNLLRGREKLDLHCCVRVRYESSVGFQALNAEARLVDVDGSVFRGPSQEGCLLILLLVIADDLRRSACKAKLFLDLYLSTRSLEAGWCWETFFAARRVDGLEKLTVNVFALLLELWDCAGEFQDLAAAIDARASLLEIQSPSDADAIMARAAKDPTNRILHDRLHTRSTLESLMRRYTLDLPHTAARLVGRQQSSLHFCAPRKADSFLVSDG